MAGTVEQTEKQQKALLTLFLQLENGSNQREGRCLWDHFLSFFFSFAYLDMFPRANNMLEREKKNLSMGSLCFLQVKEKTSLELREDSQA